jgi:hypothetical protein
MKFWNWEPPLALFQDGRNKSIHISKSIVFFFILFLPAVVDNSTPAMNVVEAD